MVSKKNGLSPDKEVIRPRDINGRWSSKLRGFCYYLRAVPLKKNLMCGFRKTCFSKTKEKCRCLSPSSVHGLGNDDESEVKKIATIILGVGQSSKKKNVKKCSHRS